MTLEEALFTLGPDAVKAAAACAIRAAHPDTGGDDVDGARIGMIKEARDCLLQFLNSAPKTHQTTCELCGGMGVLRGRFGSTPCTRCEGKGYR